MSLPVAEVGNYYRITAAGGTEGEISPSSCSVIGFYISNTTAGTVVFKDGGASGAALNGAITPAIGFHRFPATVKTSLYIVIGGAADMTVFYLAGG